MRLPTIVALLTVSWLLVGCGSNQQLREVESARAQLRSERALAERRAKEFDAQRRATMEELDHKLNLIRIAQRDFEEMVAAKTVQISALNKHAEVHTAKTVSIATRTIDAMIRRRLEALRLDLLQLKSRSEGLPGGNPESLEQLLKNLERRDREAAEKK